MINQDGSKRLDLIKQLEKTLGTGTRVITYVNGFRPFSGRQEGPATQIAQDAVRLMWDHFLAMQEEIRRDSLRVALFLISNGGDTAVPWRIVSMIREVAKGFDVIVPYNAMSAATMIALGADNIYMGPKGELGPIDPTVHGHPFLPSGGTDKQPIPVSVEDVTSFISFVREKFGIRHEDELIKGLTALTQQISPLGLGLLNRQHSYIRLVGERLLSSRNEPFEEEKNQGILASLIEEVTFHGHGISRKEAKDKLRLHVHDHRKQAELDTRAWELYRAYEEDFEFNRPIDLLAILPPNADVIDSPPYTLGGIESRYRSDLFEFQYQVSRQRQVPKEIKIQFQLPPNFQTAGSDPATLQQLLNQILQQVSPAVQAALTQQSPVIGIAPPQQIKARWERRKWTNHGRRKNVTKGVSRSSTQTAGNPPSAPPAPQGPKIH
jgi:hypothetical protein